MTLSFDSPSLHEMLLSYPENDRLETYLSYCAALQSHPEGSEDALRILRTLDKLALLWNLPESQCEALMQQAQTDWQAIQELVNREVASPRAQ
jgi:hypothetical protein